MIGGGIGGAAAAVIQAVILSSAGKATLASSELSEKAGEPKAGELSSLGIITRYTTTSAKMTLGHLITHGQHWSCCHPATSSSSESASLSPWMRVAW